jgi:hypothetical protein
MQWEYKTFTARITGAATDSAEIELQLNEYGTAGWELVSVIGTESTFLGTGRTGTMVAFFKRPLVAGEPHPTELL